MRKILRGFIYLIITLSLFLFYLPLIFASGTANVSLSGDSSVYVGNNVTVTLSINSINGAGGGGVSGVSGTLNYDSNYLEFVSAQSLAPFGISYNSSAKSFSGFDSTGSNKIVSSGNLLRLTFRAKAVGSVTISYSDPDLSDADGEVVSSRGTSMRINIVNPPSSNANLSSLSISNGNISFNPNTTSYSVKVGKDVSSVTVSATAQDAGARVSGTGSKSLNYGNNSINITVTAPSGASKTYTINVTREDPRSNNNNLKNLTVEGGTLSPAFDQNTTVYDVSVPFSVENLNVKASTQDSKAKVSISGAEGLIAEETKEVTVTVTAENGAKKVYTIRVTRGKDPNKVLSTNNYLSSLTTNLGILSPVFDREKTNYIIYLPYEMDTIELNAVVEDTRYAVLTKEGPEKLSVGSNKYTFSVSAEDSSVKVYTVIVMRGASLDNVEASNNVLLKDLKIFKGSLDKPFNNKINVYRYDKSKGFKIEPIAEDEDAKVTIIESDDVISIVVSSESETNVYTLIPKEKSNFILLVCAISGGSLFVVGGSFLGYKLGLRKSGKKIKKSKLDNSINKESNAQSNLNDKETEFIKNETETIIDKDPFNGDIE